MVHDQDSQAMQPPRPDPALKRLERFVGTWNVTGRTLGSAEDNVTWRFTFEWLQYGLGPMWEPFLLGCLICSALAALTGWVGLELLWRWQVRSKYRARRLSSTS